MDPLSGNRSLSRMVFPVDDWRTEEVRNEVRFRDFNEWINASNERMGDHRATHEYICECSDGSCREAIGMSDQEYEAIRADGNRFLIAVDHENPELDQVVRHNARFTTVAKLPGEPARIALESDPRRVVALDQN
jgi:hypothetical protein